jgi:three-Cys-motif partner protein
MSNADLYIGREQTLIKHFILRKYLERFAHIVGSHWDTLTYVDCFSGPWNVRSEKLEDSSFSIALGELRKARDTHAERGRTLRLRCFFLEKQPTAYAQLDSFAKSIADAEIKTRNATLEESVNEIVAFVQAGGQNSFPFIFIDPSGWTGFGMDTIAPLLRLNPGEVLVNFMTGHIRRFLDSPQDETQESFERLFGSPAFREKIQGLAQQDREDAAVAEYTHNAKLTGNFNFACNAIVLHPETDRTHFNLIYLTRNLRGIEVFKEAERKAMEVQEAARAEAQQRTRVARRGQGELFNGKDLEGWRFHLGKEGAPNNGTFTVRDGLLVCSGKPAGYMYTAKSYSTFTLEVEFAFKKPEGLTDDAQFRGNSGCLIHIGETNALGVWPRSIEVQGANRQLGLILPIPRNLKCKLTFDKEASDKARKPVGEFNKLAIEVKGGDMVIKLNGVVVSTVADCELTKGAIGLQSEGVETHWKNIRLREAKP